MSVSDNFLSLSLEDASLEFGKIIEELQYSDVHYVNDTADSKADDLDILLNSLSGKSFRILHQTVKKIGNGGLT